jgi:hypothetical protein
VETAVLAFCASNVRCVFPAVSTGSFKTPDDDQ